jgi:DNA primase large subunit
MREMSNKFDLLNKYPWLPSLKDYYSEIASKEALEFVSDAFSNEFSEELKERIMGLFNAAFENLETISNYKTDNLNIYTYLLLNILLYVLNNQMITNRLANLYSKITYEQLINEKNDSPIYDICQNLGLKIKYYEPPIIYGKIIRRRQGEYQQLKTNFTIHFTDYLKLASSLKDEYRKLLHNPLSGGYVFIQKKGLIRLIQEYVRSKLLIKETKDKTSLNSFLGAILKITDFNEIYNRILKAWTERKEEFEYVFQIDFENKEELSTIYPPCVQEILKKTQEGQNLIHTERLFIVWFLLALDYPVEKVVDLFSALPDFDREKTTYQVNFAKKKQYTPYKCLTLKSLNLCKATIYKDELCLEGYGSIEPSQRKKLAHPLAYTQIKQYRISKNKFYKEKESEKENE